MRRPSRVHWHLLRRGFYLWILVRTGFAVALLVTASPPTANGGVVALGVTTLSVVLGLAEVYRLEERALLANLGVAMPSLLMTLAIVPLVAEVIFAVLVP